MLLIVLGLLDIFAGFSLLSLGSIPSSILIIIGAIIALKGVASLLGSLASRYYLDWMGWVDLIAGLLLIFTFDVPFFWILLMLKGVYTIIRGFG
jgi:hypothetical protein